MRDSAPLESSPDLVNGRGSGGRGPRHCPVEELHTTPLRLVCGAIAGGDPSHPATAAAQALGRPVVIALAAPGASTVGPAGGCSAETLAAFTRQAEAVSQRAQGPGPHPASVPILVGYEVRGLAVALGEAALGPQERPWLEAAAAAAAIELLMRDARAGQPSEGRAALVRQLAGGAPESLNEALAGARELGVELRRGAVALCAQSDGAWMQAALSEATGRGWLVAEVVPERLLGLIPLAEAPDPRTVSLLDAWRQGGATVARSTPRTQPEALPGALAEAELLLELSTDGLPFSEAQVETLRLLIGVLLRERSQLVALQHSTITPLIDYDAERHTELLMTLAAFLSRHGSTRETAEALALHRHTVGYRLARVQEVSGLSPYESDGRERLSLGLKAYSVLEAQARRAARR